MNALISLDLELCVIRNLSGRLIIFGRCSILNNRTKGLQKKSYILLKYTMNKAYFIYVKSKEFLLMEIHT